MYRPGDNHFCCPVCGFKKRVSDGQYRWDKVFVCNRCFEIRHPQEMIKPIKERIAARISVPEPADNFISVTTTTSDDL
jgi:hypothetical protein